VLFFFSTIFELWMILSVSTNWKWLVNDIKHMMIISIKMITSDFKVLTYIITSIPACSYWTCYNTTDNVCVDFHNCRYFVYTAELEIFFILGLSTYCLQFYYHMLGNPDTLMVDFGERYSLYNANILNLTGLPWLWSYGSWIYNYFVFLYLCNQCLSQLTLWVWIPLWRGVLDTALCDRNGQLHAEILLISWS
jgi:hypothetical protein